MSRFIHLQAICESKTIGEDTRIWAFAHVLPGARIGKDCNICDHVFIENDVVLGDRVTVKCGVQLWDGVRVDSNVFIGPNATFTNDKMPRSKQYQEKVLETHIAYLGSATLLNASVDKWFWVLGLGMVFGGAVAVGERKDDPPRFYRSHGRLHTEDRQDDVETDCSIGQEVGGVSRVVCRLLWAT